MHANESTPSRLTDLEPAVTIRLTSLALSLSLAGVIAGCDRGTKSGSANVDTSQPSAQDAAGEVKQPGTEENRPPAEEAAAPPPAEQQSGTHVGRKTNEVLNVRELANDPKWTVVATDPQQVQGFSAPGTAYNRAAALVGTVNLEQWVKLEQASNGEWPTYEALKAYMAQNHVDMPALREYHHYGYDETKGEVVILENKEEKEGRRRELGLPPGE